MHQNIAGVLSKKEILEVALNEMSEKNETPDLICLSETFVQKHCESNILLKGYKLGASFCRLKQKRGGVCILHDDNTKIKELPLINDFATELSFECCGLELTEYKIILVVIYRTPKSNITIFFDRLHLLLDKLKTFKKHIILTGDWNIDTLKSNRISEQLTETLLSYSLDLHINTPTRERSCIDHFASSIKGAIGNTEAVCLSDHNTAQFLSVPVKNRKTQPKYWFETRRDYSAENIEKFKSIIAKYPWENQFESGCADTDFTLFHNELTLLYNLCFPIHRIKISNQTKKTEWLTKGLKISCQTKRKLRIFYYKKKHMTLKLGTVSTPKY